MSIIGSDTATNIIIFLALGVVIGTVIEWILSTFKVPFPYTVCIFYVGAILGIVVDSSDLDIQSYFDLSGVSSTIILYVFLPILLFSEAMTLNLHHLKQFFNQALLLAGPGAVIVCILIAVCCKGILPYNWPWMYCFLFGAIFCATDPVSVVSTLKASKASTKLTMIISGESLLNDGSAMILYMFFFNMINGVTYTPSLFISFCAEMLILSPIIGIAVGLVVVQIMRWLYQPLNDHMDLQILLTFIAAYLSYTIAAYFAQVSGVLSCCSAGLMIAFFAPIRILESEKYHAIWSNAEWACNTLIFLLAGFIGGLNVTYEVTVVNVCFLVLMYLIITIIRGIMLFGLLPMTNWLGKACTVQEMIFATHAGLRGALGIALALQVATNNATDHDDSNDRIGAQIFFVTTGLASFTLILNAPTASLALLKLGLIEDPEAPVSAQLELMITRIKLFMHKLLRKELEALKHELRYYNEEEVLASLSMLNTNILHSATSGALQNSIQERVQRLQHIQTLPITPTMSSLPPNGSLFPTRDSEAESETGESVRPSSMAGSTATLEDARSRRGGESSSEDIFHTLRESLSLYHDHQNRITSLEQLDHDLIAFVRKTFLDIVKAYYYRCIHTGKIGTGSLSARLLLYSIEVAYDSVDVQLHDWDVIVHALLPNRWMICLCQQIDHWCEYWLRVSPGFLAKHDAYYERLTTFTITTFIDAHEYAQQQMDYCLGVFLFDEEEEDVESRSSEGGRSGGMKGSVPKFHSMLKTKEEIQVTSECNIMLTRAKNVLTFLSKRDLEIVYTHRAINLLLQKQTEIVQKIVEEGILSEGNAHYFQTILSNERKAFNAKRKEQTRGMLLSNIQNKLELEEQEMNGRSALTFEGRDASFASQSANGVIAMQDLSASSASSSSSSFAPPPSTSSSAPSSPLPQGHKTSGGGGGSGSARKKLFVAMNEDVRENSPAMIANPMMTQMASDNLPRSQSASSLSSSSHGKSS